MQNGFNFYLYQFKKKLVSLIIENVERLANDNNGAISMTELVLGKRDEEYYYNKINQEFPKAEDIISEIKLSLKIYNISGQLMDSEDFRNEIKSAFGKDFDEVVKTEASVGVIENLIKQIEN